MTVVGIVSSAAGSIVGWENLDPVPEPADVNAGLLGLIVFLGLIAALVLLVVTMNRQLRRVRRNNDAGVYDDLHDPRRGSRPARPQQPRPQDDDLGEPSD